MSEESLFEGITDSQVLNLLCSKHPQMGNQLLGCIVDVGRRRTDAPLVYHVGTGLGLLSALAPPNLRYRAPEGLVGPAIWTLLVGKSGQARKSSCVKMAERLLLESAPERHGGSPPGSSEALEDYLQAVPVSAMFQDEYSGFLRRTAKPLYEDIRMVMTAAYDGTARGRRLVDRVSAPPGAGVRMSLIAGLSLGYFDEVITDADTRSGFLARHGMFLAHRERWVVYNAHQQDQWELLVRYLKGFAACELTEASTCEGFTPAALEVWSDFLQRCDRLQQGKGEGFQAAVVRGQEYAMRAAVLLAFSLGLDWYKADGPWLLEALPVAVAAEIGWWTIRSAGQLLGNMATTPYQRLHRTLIHAFLDNHGSLGLKQIHRILKCPPREVLAVLNGLTAEGRVTLPFNTTEGETRYMLLPTPAETNITAETLFNLGLRPVTSRDELTPWIAEWDTMPTLKKDSLN